MDMQRAILHTILTIGIITVSQSAYGEGNYGAIRGKVVDSETGDPLPSVNIMLKDLIALGSSTNLDGEYVISEVPSGVHSLAVSMMGYTKAIITDVQVNGNEATMINISLVPEIIELGEVIVSARRSLSTVAGLLSSRKSAPMISDGIASEQMKNSPDGDAADALKRVTGLSVVGGKYIYVRGLGERYSKTILNRSTLPSPEPDKRVVPLDIFPTGLLDNIVVLKTFTPDLPGDFAGGGIKLTTKEFPDNMVMKFSTSTGFNTETTFQEFQTYKGGGVDFLGIDDGSRSLPDIVKEADGQKIVEGGQFGGGFTARELEMIGESFSNIWEPYSIRAPLEQKYSLSIGNRSYLAGKPLGYTASLIYDQGYSFRKERLNFYTIGADGLEIREEIDSIKTSKFSVLWGGIANLSYRVSPLHKLSIKNTYTHTADKEVKMFWQFPHRSWNSDIKGTRLSWVEQTMLSSQLSGEHILPLFGSELEWRTTYSIARREEPDTRETLYRSDMGENNFRLADETNSGSRFFSNLIDHNIDVGIDWKVPLRAWSRMGGNFKLGGNVVYKNREADSRRFRFKPQDFHDVDISQSPEEIFIPDNIGPGGFQLGEDTRRTDNYRGEQTVIASYLLVDMPIVRRLRMSAGARLEFSDQKVTTYELFNPDDLPVISRVQTTDILPAINLTYRLTPLMNLRVGASQTVSRPDFRELTEFEFTDIGERAVIGNPLLERALIQNYDIRWEWYPDIGELISIGLFYKYFNRPIEVTFYPGEKLVSSWRNAKFAYNYRAELEARKSLDFLSPVLSGFSLSGNLALIRSRVKIPEGGIETYKDRPLQGQSPYVVNLTLMYSNNEWGTDANLLYNVFGKRISAVGIHPAPNIYEQPFNRLDFVLRQSIWRNINLKLSAKNILDSEVRVTQGGKIQRSYKRGRSISLGLSYRI